MSADGADAVRWRTPVPLGHDARALFADSDRALALLALPDGDAAALADALVRGATEDDLLDLVGAAGPAAAARWLQVFAALCRVGRALPTAGTALGDLEVTVGAPVPSAESSPPPALRLSRFAVITPAADGALWLEEPVAGVRAVLPADLLAALLAADERVGHARQVCWRYGLLVAADDAQESWWEPHDRYFHWRTRRDGHGHISGATFPHDGRRPPLPVSPALRGLRTVALPEQPGESAMPADASPHFSGAAAGPLRSVLAKRTSTRDCAAPVRFEDIAAFLSLHRVLGLAHQGATGNGFYPQSRRLYPGGGATYELELCLTAAGVPGLADGIWWFDAVANSLVLLTAEPGAVAQVFDDALISSGGVGTPRVIVSYLLRMGRNSWKYEGMSYRLALLDAGVLYHHAYLASAELGLGVCGLGNGSSALLANLIGHGQEDLASIAEIMITGRLDQAGARAEEVATVVRAAGTDDDGAGAQET